MTRSAVLAVVAAVAASGATPALGQQVLEADHEAGRTVIDGPYRAISLYGFHVGIGHSEKAVYVRDLEEPEGVMVFSLVTGELLRTVGIRKGDGPAELRAITSITPASDGGMYVSGFERVLEFDSHGTLESSWTIQHETGRNVCELDGAPTVIGQAGNLVRRGADGTHEVVGEWSLPPLYEYQPDETRETVLAAYRRNRSAYYHTTLTCTGGAAFVLMIPESGRVGSLSVVRRRGPIDQMELPSEFQEERDWHRAAPSLDGQDNIVLISEDNLIWGALIEPDTGCYAILRNPGGSRLVGQFYGIYGDSAVVLHRDYEEYRDGVRKVVTVWDTAARVSLVPFRRVSGDPCPGMFPSLDGGAARGSSGAGEEVR